MEELMEVVSSFFQWPDCPLCKALWRAAPSSETAQLGDFFQHGKTVSEDWDHLIIYNAELNELVVYIFDTEEEETTV